MGDLLAPRPVVYWADFLTSLVVGSAALRASLAAPAGSGASLGWGVMAALAILRIAAFRQEIARLRRGEMTAFTWGWNLLAGIPLLMPGFRAATTSPGPTGDQPRGPTTARHLNDLLAVPCLPVAVAAALVGGWPLRPGLAVGGRIPLTLLAVSLAVITLDRVRALVAARLLRTARTAAPDGHSIDGVNIEGPLLLAESLFPVGMRYGALQRCLPMLPYHHLAAAHRRILEALPDWEAYRAATLPSLLGHGTPPQPRRRDTRTGVRRAG